MFKTKLEGLKKNYNRVGLKKFDWNFGGIKFLGWVVDFVLILFQSGGDFILGDGLNGFVRCDV